MNRTSFWIIESHNYERSRMIMCGLSGVVAIRDQGWAMATVEKCRERLELKHG